MAKDPERQAYRAHQEWLGYVQPVGLVVSPVALLAAGAHVNENIIPEHQRFLDYVEPIPINGGEDAVLAVTDLPGLLQEVFGWELADLISGPSLDSLEVVLPEYGETLRPTYAVKEFKPDDEANPWLMLIQTLPNGTDLDAMLDTDDHKWQASPHAHFERLLRETKIPIGLLFNGTHFRLVYAPRGETSGYATFRVKDMAEVSGRLIFAAFEMLLGYERLYSVGRKQRLPYLLSESRKYQNLVSTQLSEQVLHSLYELLRGFQAADDMAHGELLRQVLKEDPNHVYAGLLNVLLRLVFVLYAEDRGLMPGDSVYGNFYGVNGLFERLRSDASRFPDTMDQRYGAWAQLLSLFRLIHDGASHGSTFKLPPRHGHLFNPDRYPFLEGRPYGSARQVGATVQPPMVSDGIVFRVLQNLLILDGERISYRTLDVEQIGSVYETVMGFVLEVAKGRSIAIKPAKPHGAPVTINLDALLETNHGNRAKLVKEHADQSITGEALRALQDAATPEDLVAALGRKVSPATPRIVPPGAMILQPSNERRKQGAHYTPRSLTEPIVRTTLRPVLEQLGDKPKPEQILDLKVCDPAMGSGAFLVEADRQLADELVKAWHNHNCVPAIPPDEDEVLFARRLVVQRCLYGVDKNPMAVDLAKLALWLATLAKDHAFTFVDHALRCGDSLVGLTRKQIAAFHWQPAKQISIIEPLIKARLDTALDLRHRIQTAGDDANETDLRLTLKEADEALDEIRAIGDAVIAAFFAGKKDREREQNRQKLADAVREWLEKPSGGSNPCLSAVEELHSDTLSIDPLHWQIEFPEVFQGETVGFDAIVGNPPFAGKNTLINSTPDGYLDWLKVVHEEAHGNADLVAHFFRRAFNLLREQGAFGLIATNTIGQGDTRTTGLRWICTHGGIIFNARKRYRWPGQAAVVVSVVHVAKGIVKGSSVLNGHAVPDISAYLVHGCEHESPVTLPANAEKSFQGSIVLGLGFTFDNSDTTGAANSLAEMTRLIANNPRNAERIFPYLGGEEVSESPIQAHHRYVINFADFPLKRACLGQNWAEADERRRETWHRTGTVPLDYPYPVAADWPDLLAIVQERVKPERDVQKRDALRQRWWQYAEKRPGLVRATEQLERMLVNPLYGAHLSFVFLSPRLVANNKLNVMPLTSWSVFCVLQTRPHEIWARFFSSTLKDDLAYTPTDCFETFPFPKGFETNPALESAGKEYYEYRAALMVRNNEGLTKTYNRFHDPEEHSPDILRLRELHASMDRAVLDAYGWTDLHPTCEFILDYEEEEDEDETPTRGRGRGEGRGRKKPWRYRWPDDFRDEVLARLLELNRQYAEQERLSGAAAEKKGKRTCGKRAKTTTEGVGSAQGDLNLR